MLAFHLLLAAAASAQDPMVTFKNWVAGCDNGRACMAVAEYSADNYELASSVLQRGPGAEDIADFWFDVPEKPFVDLAADGRPLALKFVRRNDRYGVERVHVVPESMPKIIAALKSATGLAAIGSDGNAVTQFSISGASAAMRWIDVQQKRDGTVTALVASGSKPASAVPPPPALPTVPQARASGAKAKPLSDAEIRKIQQKYADCSDDGDLSDKAEYARLDAHSTLAIVTAVCASGAYNYYGIPLIIGDNGKKSIADFDQRDDSDLTMNLSWDDKTRQLSSYFKGRGIGDCGGGTDWVWDGKKFRAIRETAMGDCMGAITWITLYRARPVPL